MDSSPKETPLATYKQIAVSLRTRIHEGQWTVGAMLPSRRDLAREYGVSPITIERAITHLIADGVLRADDRRGTFVASAGTGAVAAPAAPPVARRGPATAVIDTPPITPRYA